MHGKSYWYPALVTCLLSVGTWYSPSALTGDDHQYQEQVHHQYRLQGTSLHGPHICASLLLQFPPPSTKTLDPIQPPTLTPARFTQHPQSRCSPCDCSKSAWPSSCAPSSLQTTIISCSDIDDLLWQAQLQSPTSHLQ